jgi:hypothetical protein
MRLLKILSSYYLMNLGARRNCDESEDVMKVKSIGNIISPHSGRLAR